MNLLKQGDSFFVYDNSRREFILWITPSYSKKSDDCLAQLK